MVIGSPDIN